MSTETDRRIVEMRFDNKQFESGVSETMSTLGKFKQSLNMDGATKGLENVNSAAKKVDMSGLANGVETVGLKFNAMYTIADQALRNITNSAMAAGKKMISALTIDPIKTGFEEYETQINAVQTILANTESKGSTIDDVNEALEALNKYADQTIYNFTEMTRNIGTFTAAGVDLDTSVNAIQGIANLAAVSGSTSQQASTAMYQLSQALSSGTVKLMDWNSVVNAGMGGQVFQDALKETARVHGVAIDDMIEKQGSFRETLSDGWLTSEILTETLMKFTMATEGLTEAEIEANREKLKGLGYTDEQIEAIFKLGDTATNAATKVKTFTQLWDVLKESAQSGWSQSWKIIIGDFEEAKALLTPLANFLTGAINKISDWRNNLLEGALGKNFVALADKIKAALNAVNGITDAIGNMGGVLDTVSGALKDYDTLVDEIIRGDWGNAPTRWQDLAAAGYDWAHAQNLVNERLGCSVRHATDYKDAQNGAANSTNKNADATGRLTEENIALVESLVRMSDEELRALGYTEEQIAAFRELQSIADKLGLSVGFLLEHIDEINGRWLLINTFKNAGKGLVQVITAIKDAWIDVFPLPTVDQLFNIIAALHKFSTKLIMSEESVEQLKWTFKGLFSILDIFLKIVGGPIKLVLGLIGKLLGKLDLNILEVTGKIGYWISSFNDWLETNSIVAKALDMVADAIKKFFDAFKVVPPIIEDNIKGFKEWIESLKNAEDLPKAIADGIVNGFKNIPSFFKSILKALRDELSNTFGGGVSINFDVVKSFLNSLREGLSVAGQVAVELGKIILEKINSILRAHGMEEISADMIAGFVNGIKARASEVWATMIELGKNILAKIKEVLGIHSPSTQFFAIGTNITDGLLNGLKNGASGVYNFIKTIGQKCIEIIKDIDFGKLLAAGIGVGMLTIFGKIANAASSLTKSLGEVVGGVASMIEDVGDMFEGLGRMFKGLGSYFRAKAWEARAKAVLNMAIALGILVAAVYVLTKIEPGKLWAAIGALAALAAIVVALAFAAGQMGKAGVTFGAQSLAILAIAGAILILSFALSKMASIEGGDIPKILGLLASSVLAMAGIMIVIGTFVKGKTAMNINKAGAVILKMSFVLLSMVGVMKLASMLKPEDIVKGTAVIILIEGLMAGMIAISKLAGKNASKAGSMILKMSIALLIMIGVIALAGQLDGKTAAKGLLVIAAIEALFAGIIAISKLAGPNATKAGAMLLMMSIALAITAFVVKQAGSMDAEEVKRGLAVVAALELLFAAVIASSRLAGANAIKAGAMLLMMSFALLIVAGIVFILSKMDPDGLKQGIAAVTALEICFAGLIAVTKLAKGGAGMAKTLMWMVIALGVMAAIVIGFSFLDPDALKRSVAALSVLMLAFGSMIALTKFAKTTKTIRKTLIEMLIVVGVLALIVAALSFLPNTDGLMTKVGALSILLMAFSASMAILGATGRISNTVTKNLIPMLAVVAGLALILAGLSFLPNPDALIPITAALSILLLAFSASMVILGAAGRISATVTKNLFVMLAVVAGLALILSAMSFLPNPNALMPIALALSLLLGALTAALLILSFAGPSASAAIVPAMLMGVVIAELALVLAALSFLPNIDALMPTALALSVLLMALSAACILLIPVGLTGPAAIVGAGVLAAVIAILGALAIGIGELMTYIPPSKIEEWKTGIKLFMELLSVLAYGLGDVVGSFIGGLMDGIMSGLPEIGASLSQFMVNAMPFIVGARMVDDSVSTGVEILADAIISLAGANILESFSSLFTGGSSLADLGTELSNFMTNAKGFIDGVSGLDPTMCEGVKSLAEAMLVLTGANLMDQLTAWLTGDSSLADFGAELAAFGPSMAEYAKAVAGIDTAAVTASAEAAKTLAEMAKALPNEGGLLGKIFGENSMDTFGEQLTSFGKSMKDYSGVVAGLDVDAINISVEAAKKLSEFASDIPNFGGVVGFFTGDNDMVTFGEQLVAFGRNLKTYSIWVAGMNSEAVTISVNAATELSKMASSIDNMGGVVSWFCGDNDLAKFGENLVSFGVSLMAYAITVTGLNTESISNSVTAATKLTELANAVPDSGLFVTDDLANFANDIQPFGSALSGYSAAVATVDADAVSAATSAAYDLIDLVNSTAGLDSSGVYTFQSAVNTLGNTAVDDFVNAFKNATGDLSSVGTDMVNALIEGIESKLSSITTTVSDGINEAIDSISSKVDLFKAAGLSLMIQLSLGFSSGVGQFNNIVSDGVSRAVSAAKDCYYNFYSAGAYLAYGFAYGIRDTAYAAEVEAAAMALAAKKAAEDALGINSPSKVFSKIGGFTAQGFIKGLGGYASKVYKTSAEMAKTARSGLSDAIGSVMDVINSDVDSQPTIRPVLDLSDVRAGVGSIGSIFGNNPSVGVLANVGVVSSMMNRNQNGPNGDVVNAIDKLRKDVGNMGNTTYSINGITYDDEGVVTEAIRTLVRAARVERRV